VGYETNNNTMTTYLSTCSTTPGQFHHLRIIYIRLWDTMSGLANFLHKSVVVSLMGLTGYAIYVFTAGVITVDKRRKQALKELREKV